MGSSLWEELLILPCPVMWDFGLLTGDAMERENLSSEVDVKDLRD